VDAVEAGREAVEPQDVTMAGNWIPGVICFNRLCNSFNFFRDDPSTDFRGMGILGLENLIYFAQHEPESCSHLLKLSENEVHGYALIFKINFIAH
jgi:hypothetical protein